MSRVNLSKHEEIYDISVEEVKRLGRIENPSLNDKVDLNVTLILKEYFEETFRVLEERNKPLAWTGSCITPEIFIAMDIHPYSPDFLGGIMFTFDQEGIGHYIAISENAGIPPEMCTNDRATIGLLLSGEIPKPDLYIASGLPCDNLVMTVDMYRNYYPDTPTFVLDAPYGNDEEDIQYYTQDMKKMVQFLEEQTGRKLDYDRLREILKITNEGYSQWLELCELRKAVPTPQPASLLGMQEYLDMLASGKPEYASFYTPILEDAKEKVKRGAGVVEKERHRTIWFMLPIYFDFSLFTWLEQDLGITIPMDMMSYINVEPLDLSTPDSMLRWLALRSLNAPMARQLRGSVELYTDDLIRICEEYRGDSVIFAGHQGCKMAWGMVGLVRDICKEMNKPLLVFFVDALYSQTSSSSEIRNTLEGFFKTLGVI